MTQYTLTSPLVIGPRLMPAVIVALDTETYGTISAEIDHHDGERYVLHYVIDTSGETFEGTDLRSGACRFVDGDHDAQLRSMVGALLSFLGAEADRYGAWMDSGDATPAGGWSFGEGIAEWAYLNSDELTLLREQIEGDEY
jgi:hypothetical protein